MSKNAMEAGRGWNKKSQEQEKDQDKRKEGKTKFKIIPKFGHKRESIHCMCT
jgi:hypothetical protein